MKTKYTGKEGLHKMLDLWYNNNDDSLKRLNCNSVFTDKNSIYSYGYHYELMRKTNKYVFINSNNSTRTTNKQRIQVKYWATINSIPIINGIHINEIIECYVKSITTNYVLLNNYNYLVKNKKQIPTELKKKYNWIFQKKNAKIIEMVHSENDNVRTLVKNILKEKKYI